MILNELIKNVKPNMRKAEIYKAFGIEYKDGKILYPVFGWDTPLLQNGNTKVGKNVYTWSTLPTNKEFTAVINGVEYTEKGTCVCSCVGCYATKGNYNYSTTIAALLKRTYLARHYLDFMVRAIAAQIIADKVVLLRIHASGDFFSAEYVEAWKELVKAFPSCLFWTYTKVQEYESAFDDFSNANIVKSVIFGYGFNFGHCDYILKVYKALSDMGLSVYICRCGIDNNQHCTTCHGCAEHDFVLFLEHSTGYKAEKDPLFEEVKAIIDSQTYKAF